MARNLERWQLLSNARENKTIDSGKFLLMPTRGYWEIPLVAIMYFDLYCIPKVLVFFFFFFFSKVLI